MDETAVTARMAKSVEALRENLRKIRTGRAHAGLLDQVKVSCYGQEMPLTQIATVAVGGSRLLTVSVWDAANLAAAETAIRESDLGINPSNDGSKVLVPLPELSEDRRAELVKLVKREAEEARVAIRNIRRDELSQLKDSCKAKEIGENELRRGEKELQKLTDAAIAQVEEQTQTKANELMQM